MATLLLNATALFLLLLHSLPFYDIWIYDIWTRPLTYVALEPLSPVATDTLPAHVPAGLTQVAWQRILTQIEQERAMLRLPLMRQGSNSMIQIKALPGDEVAKFTASEAQAGDHFGFAVAVDGDTVLVGADEASGGPEGTLPRAGVVYVFSRNQDGPDAWGQVAKLTASDAQANDGFGVAVALDGDTALVGSRQVQESDDPSAPAPEAGAAYIFARHHGGTDAWGRVAKISAADGQAGDYFGLAVALDGDTALVGAYQADGGVEDSVPLAGAAYVFIRDAGGPNAWGQVTKLSATDAQYFDYFGYDVALDGDTALIGALFEDGGEGDPLELAGAAYVFSRHHGGANAWGQVAKLTAGDRQALDHFGYAVAIHGDTALIGAPYEAGGAGDPVMDAGAVYLFRQHQDGTDRWGQVGKLTAADIKSSTGFGLAVALDENTAIVGAYTADSDAGGVESPLSHTGAVYVYRLAPDGGEAWEQVAKLIAADAQSLDGFGIAVALDGDAALVGAFREAGGVGDPVPEGGAAYIYQIASFR